jgi:hypothetical protein
VLVVLKVNFPEICVLNITNESIGGLRDHENGVKILTPLVIEVKPERRNESGYWCGHPIAYLLLGGK